MQNTIRRVGPDGPGTGGGLLNLVKKPTKNRSTGDVVREEKTRELAIMQNAIRR